MGSVTSSETGRVLVVGEPQRHELVQFSAGAVLTSVKVVPASTVSGMPSYP
jgi:hypothetical protein